MINKIVFIINNCIISASLIIEFYEISVLPSWSYFTSNFLTNGNLYLEVLYQKCIFNYTK